jgi:nucleotidyltransferase substrate binding protein (TIGR01987 family)
MSERSKAQRAAENFELALSKLLAFIAQSGGSELEQAGVIQAFEFTFEVAWKAFQKTAEGLGTNTPSPKQSLAAAFRLGIIDDEETWLMMLEDRNLTSHTYNRAVAERIYTQVRMHYAARFEQSLVALKRLIS